MPNDDPQFPVAIVGAGPVGLALALGLSRHGVRSVLVERKPATNEQSRAPPIHMRTLEVLRQWDRGVARSLLAAGTLKRSLSLYPGPTIDEPLLTFPFGELDEEADHAGVLFLEQGHTERILLGSSVPLYERHGFVVTGEVNLPHGGPPS